jgi:acetyl esterase/lipase
VDYRLAPEHPYPACIEDIWEAYQWVLANAGKLNVNANKIAVSGASAGGNLSAVLTHKVINYNKTSSVKLPTIKYNLLQVPAVDADIDSYWTAEEFKHVPDLCPRAISWFSNHYYVGRASPSEPDLSPIKNPDENFEQYPATFIATAETDMLRGQGEAYAAKLIRHGVPVSYKMYKGVSHIFSGLPGVNKECDELILDLCKHLRACFYDEPSV